MPSTLTTVSNPRTARLDRIRSTMLGSSSTTRAQVLRASSVIVGITAVPSDHLTPSARPPADGPVGCAVTSGYSAERSGRLAPVHDLRLHGQVHAEAGALAQRDQLDPAAVSLHDSLGDGQAEAGPGVPAAAFAAVCPGARSVAGGVA